MPGKGKQRIGSKIGYLINEEGLTPKQAAGKAFGMARHGNLGSAAKSAAGRKRHRKMHYSTHGMDHMKPSGLQGTNPVKY